MKSAILASLLLGSMVAAAPFDKRKALTTTQVVTETIIVYTTVYDDATPTSMEGLFYEKPSEPTGAQGTPGNSPAATPAAPAPQEPAPTTTTTKAPAAPSTTEQAQPTTTQAAQQQAPQQQAPQQQAPQQQAPQQQAPQQQAPQQEAPKQEPTTTTQAAQQPQPTQPSSSSGGSTTGEQYSNVDITIYDNNGGFGACGTELHDSDMIVALAQPAWGASTYDVMTGAATNPWCGQKIKVEYEGNSIEATIMDMCPGCSGHDIDLSLSAWKALTGKDEKTRLKASWSKMG